MQKNINVLILKLRDLTSSQFNSIGLGSALVALSDWDEKTVVGLYRVISQYHSPQMHTTRKKYLSISVSPPLHVFRVCLFAWYLTALSAQIGYIVPYRY